MIFALALTFHAQPNVVIFGGGWGSEGTQVSIESHVALLAEVLKSAKPTVLFAGDPGVRSVQVASDTESEVDAILGLVFDRRDHLQVTYRPKQVSSAKASKAALVAAITTSANGAGLAVFGAGHGAPASDEQPAALELWGPDDRLGVVELARVLDQLGKGPVAFVLGHCHSGAFSDLMYREATPGPVASPARCVLAAVPADREAAGCTPDIDDPSARAYVALISDAFRRNAGDYDKDGAVSLSEAHAYAKIHDSTVDIPVSSSELFLIGRLGHRLPGPEVIRPKALLAKATSSERAIIEQSDAGRLARLGPAQAADELRALEAAIDLGAQKVDEILDRRDLARRRLVDGVLSRWPELINPYHRESRRILAGDATGVITFVMEQADYREVLQLDEEIGARDGQILELERKAARLERFIRTMQVVAGRPLLGRADRKSYEMLSACEGMKPLAR